jgi:hypothetical protein
VAVPARRVCANHPERSAHALCMSCGKLVCGECATAWDGVNYCVTCLAARRGALAGGASLFGGLLLLVACVVFFAASTELLLWFAALCGQML